jgi:hypothetical protein
VTNAWYTRILLSARFSRLYTRSSVDLNVRLRYAIALMVDLRELLKIGVAGIAASFKLSCIASSVDMIASAVSIMSVQFLRIVSQRFSHSPGLVH